MTTNVQGPGNSVMPVILQVVGELSRLGGVETVAWELGEAWSRAHIETLFLTCTVMRPTPERCLIERVTPWLSGISRRGTWRYLGRLITVPIFTIAATRALQRHRDAIVISHGDTLEGDILVVHAINKISLQEKRREHRWAWLLNPIHLWTAWRDARVFRSDRYRRFVAVSQRVKEDLIACYDIDPARIAVIPNGIDLNRFRFDPGAKARIREAWSIPMDVPLLLFVGHEFDRKGLGEAILALAQLPQKPWLLVVGSDAAGKYRRLARQHGVSVVFTGAQSDLPSFYSASDAFILPTNYETFSLVCMEAMACSLPVFATKVGGIEDYLVSGRNGHVIPRDADGIAQVLAPYLADREKLAALRSGARETAMAFDWNRIGEAYLRLVVQVARQKWARETPASPPVMDAGLQKA